MQVNEDALLLAQSWRGRNSRVRADLIAGSKREPGCAHGLDIYFALPGESAGGTGSISRDCRPLVTDHQLATFERGGRVFHATACRKASPSLLPNPLPTSGSHVLALALAILELPFLVSRFLRFGRRTLVVDRCLGRRDRIVDRRSRWPSLFASMGCMQEGGKVEVEHRDRDRDRDRDSANRLIERYFQSI